MKIERQTINFEKWTTTYKLFDFGTEQTDKPTLNPTRQKN